MYHIMFVILLLPNLLMAQPTSPSNEDLNQNVESKKEIRLIRAVDDRRQLIRQRRDLIDLDEQSTFQSEVQVEK